MSLKAFAIALAGTALTTLAAAPALALTDPVSVAKGYHAPKDAWGHPDLAEGLLDLGADASIRDSEGRTALTLCARYIHHEHEKGDIIGDLV